MQVRESGHKLRLYSCHLTIRVLSLGLWNKASVPTGNEGRPGKLNLSGPARVCVQCAHLLGGVWGHAAPGNFWNFRRSEIDSGAFWDTCRSWQGTCYKLTIAYLTKLLAILHSCHVVST